MDRGASSVLIAQGATATARQSGGPRGGHRLTRRLRGTLAGFGDSCALAGIALLVCLALIAVGTLGSLAWMLVTEL